MAVRLERVQLRFASHRHALKIARHAVPGTINENKKESRRDD